MIHLALLAVLALPGPEPREPPDAPRLLAVRMGEVQRRPALQVLCTAPLAEVGLSRQGAQVVLTFHAEAPPVLPQPTVAPPLLTARLARAEGRLELRVTLPPEIPYDVRREGTVLHLVFGEAPPPSPRDVRSLYARLFPVAPSGGAGSEGTEATAAVTSPPPPERPREGLVLGPAVVRPTVDMLYVDGQGTLLVEGHANRDGYLEVRPKVAADMPLGNGTLGGDYELRARAAAELPEVRSSTQLANLRLAYPLGGQVSVRASEHYARGTLEATEVDPGREYFFRLARFRRHALAGGLQVETAARVKVDLSGSFEDVDLDEESGFFDYQRRQGRLGLTYELSPTLEGLLGYARERVPPSPARPLVESNADVLQAGLKGELTPLMRGEVSLGYMSQVAPRVEEPGRRFRGFTASARLSKDFSRSTTLALSALRDTQVSSFEGNAFYVGTGARVEATVGGPFELALRLGTGVQWNRYRLAAQELGVPRHDRIVDWSVGAGRPLGRWAFVRADLSRERRDSNLDRLDTRAWSLVAQIGLGWLNTPVQP